MKKRKNIFKPLIGVDAKNKEIPLLRHSKNERWLYGILSADKEAPNIEDEKPERRLKLYFFVILFLFIALFARSFHLQIIQGYENLILAQDNRFRVQTTKAPRGLFYDRNKIPLVKNVPNYEVIVIPNNLPRDPEKKDSTIKKASEIIGMREDEIRKIISEKKPNYTQGVLVKKSITQEVSLLFESQKPELQGFYVNINPIREYLDKGSMAHLLGYVGRISENELKNNPGYQPTDYIGKSGLESAYEDILKGVDGKEKVEVDSLGRVVRTFGKEYPVLGSSVVLTVDFELQKIVTEALKKQMEVAGVNRASAVAINPQNGEVLSMVSLPGFDNNLFSGGISEKDYRALLEDEDSPLLNRVVAGEYPSGSTIKPFLAAAALDRGTITEETTVLSTGGIEVGIWRFPDWKVGGHGVTDVLKAIAESVNTFFYAIGGGYKNIVGLGPALMKEYLERFGFGKPVVSDLVSSADGHLPSPEWKKEQKGEDWFLGDTYNMSIGQGDVLVTPFQLVNALGMIANGGTMYRPIFIKEVIGEGGVGVPRGPGEVVSKDLLSREAIEITRKGMRETITNGSGRALADLPIPTAGKTGTAEFGPNNSKKHSWFTAFAPYENPTIAIVVLIEGAGDGSEFAVPATEDILRWYFSR